MGARPALSAPQRVVLALLATFPALAVALYLLVGDVRALAEPTWSLSQPRGQYIATAALVKGTILLGAGLGVAGLARDARGIALAGAALLAAVGLPLLLSGVGLLVLLAAAMLFAATRIATS